MGKQKITKKFLINELRSFVLKNGRTPTRREFGYATPIRTLFGSYTAFITSQGYPKNNPGYQALTKQELFEELNAFVKEYDRIPSRREFGHEPQIKKLFGAFNQMIQSAGFEPNPPASFAESLVGRQFGCLTIESKSEKMINRQTTWNAICVCGNRKKDIPRGLLTSGQVHSCGCLQKETVRNLEKVKKYRVEGTNLLCLSKKIPANNKTGVRGVYYNKRRKKYVANIEFKGKRHFLGYYDDLSDAEIARK